MIYSQKELAQLVIEYSLAYQIKHVIISPGSRNAPLIIGFTNQPRIRTYSVVDERCAAFVGLGIAQQLQQPTVLVCTSGSALLNYYPAVAEAFYSTIPLIVLSADRPKHLIDIGDGQTIRQENVFKNHSLYNANLSEGRRYEADNKQQLEMAFKTAIEKHGPVHINVPFDEPLYEITDKLSIKKIAVKEVLTKQVRLKGSLTKYAAQWNKATKKMVLIGSHFPNKELQEQLAELAKDPSVLVFTETISNVHHPVFINNIDQLIFPLTDKEFEKLQPEILLTLGGMIVSKKIKQFLRMYRPREHWHIDAENAPDTYHCLTQHVKTTATLFFEVFLPLVHPLKSTYRDFGLTLKKQRKEKHQQFLAKAVFSDLKVFDIVVNHLPANIQLQLGNSSIIRYSQLFDIQGSLRVFCNRGTSGIDGSTATAIGAALAVKETTVLITGDISFLYDSNALWNNYMRNDFRIILINNGGGGIFRFIPGPSTTNALNYFEAPHRLTAKQLCEMYHLEYHTANNERDLKEQLEVFYINKDKPKLLEIFTPTTANDFVLKEYFKFL